MQTSPMLTVELVKRGGKVKFVLDKLKEVSTWRGFTMILTAFGLKITPEYADAIVAAGVGIAGVIDVIKKD